jgi:hypothetical protein
MSITFVTALYDLSKLEPGRRSLSYYLDKGKSWKDKNINVVAFTEEEYANPSNYPANSKIIIKPFTDLPDHALMTHGVKRLIPLHPKDTPNYFVLMSSKFYFLREAIKSDLYKSDFIAWLDYGIAHVANTEQLDKLNLTVLPEGLVKLANFENITVNDKLPPSPGYHSHVEARVACGMMVGTKQAMLDLCDLFDKTYRKWLSADIIGLEGWVVSKLVALYPEKFIIYPADYAQIISNFNGVMDNIPRCLHLADMYAKTNDFHRAMLFYCSFLKRQEGTIRIITPLTPEQTYTYLVNFYTIAIWVSPDLAYSLANYLVNLALLIPGIQRKVVENYLLLEKYFEQCVVPDLPMVKININNPSNTLKAMENAVELSKTRLVTVVMEGVRNDDIRRFKVANPRYL